MQQQALDLGETTTPTATDTKPTGITFVALGGSHRALQRAARALERAGIPYRSCGPVALYSKRISFAIPSRCVEQVRQLAIGATVQRDQPRWAKTTTEERYFGSDQPITVEETQR